MGRWIGGGGVGELHEVNDEAGNAKSMSIIGLSEVQR